MEVKHGEKTVLRNSESLAFFSGALFMQPTSWSFNETLYNRQALVCLSLGRVVPTVMQGLVLFLKETP
jgi:hypothetical protein